MLIIKGIIIGLGKIIPGVSGSMLAISMGIYSKLISSINNFLTDYKSNFKFLFKVGLGVFISILFFSKIILLCLNKFYLITIFLFIGLIIGSLDEIKKEIKKENNYIIYISFIIVSLLGFLNINNEININNNLSYFFFYVLAGFLDAFTMIIPGISGTATLMLIGAYNPLMSTFSNLLNFNLIMYNLKVLIPFSIGLIIGIILTVKLVNYLFKNFKSKTFSSIMGFSLSTILLMGLKCLNTKYSLIQLILAFIFLFIGIFLSKKINHYVTND